MLGQRKKAELNTGSETSRVSHVFAVADRPAVQFGQAVYEVMAVRLDAVVHRKVDDLQVLRNVVTFHELAGIAVCRTEEQYVDRVQRKLVGEDEIRFSIQAFVYVSNLVSGVAGAVDKLQFLHRDD